MPVKEACNLGSGYLFSKPLPADGIVSFLQRRGVPRERSDSRTFASKQTRSLQDEKR